MKPSLLLLAALFFSRSALAVDVPNCFVGRWKSDEALTLEDMRKHPEVTEKALLLFEKNFFGRLVLVFGPRYAGGYLEGEQSRKELSFQRVDVIDMGPDWAILRSKLLGVEQYQGWHCPATQCLPTLHSHLSSNGRAHVRAAHEILAC